MIGQQSKSFLARTLQSQQRYGSLVQASQRGFAGGGPKKPAIGADETDFDVVCIGKSPPSSRFLSLRRWTVPAFWLCILHDDRSGEPEESCSYHTCCFNLIDCGSPREIIIIFRCLVFA